MKKQLKVLLLGCLLISGWSCKKIKEDIEIDYKNLLNTAASNIRIYNASNGTLDVSVNNMQLTNYEPISAQVPTSKLGTELGLAFFPDGVWRSGSNGSPFTVPMGLVKKNGEVHLSIRPGRPVSNSEIPGPVSKDTMLINDPSVPRDYFLLSDGSIREMQRVIAAPVRPDHFKIRILNLGDGLDELGLGEAVSLTYANGQEIDPRLSNVARGNASQYVELPYGTYQFKVFGGGDFTKQVTEVPTNPLFEPCNRVGNIQVAREPILRTFKPGGTYTILVTRNRYRFVCNDPFAQEKTLDAHGYRVLSEISSPLNTSYARMQFVNALPGKAISVALDGIMEANGLAFPQSTSYTTIVTGNHSVRITDGSGKVLAESEYTVSPADNITVWAHEKNGAAAIAFVQNSMGAYRYNSGINDNDGTNGSLRIDKYELAWQSRFLNLSADVSQVTFSNSGRSFMQVLGSTVYGTDTLNRPGSYEELAQGEVPVHDPYIMSRYTPTTALGQPGVFFSDYSIYVHNSSNGEVPGPTMAVVAPVLFKDFIADRSIYPAGMMPAGEIGVFTVALVGRISANAPAAEKARLIIVKHNQ